MKEFGVSNFRKRDIRVWLADVAQASGAVAFAEKANRNRLTVLTYHRVLPDSLMEQYLFPSMAVSESLFSKQMALLKDSYHIVGLQKGVELLEVGAKPDRPLLSITFDDGYSDNWTCAAPIMAKFDVKATFFVVSDLIGTNIPLWYDIAARCWRLASVVSLARAVSGELPWKAFNLKNKPSIESWMTYLKILDGEARLRVMHRLEDPGPDAERHELDCVMSAQNLRSLVADGHSIGSHSCTHPLLPQLTDSELKIELRKSKFDLESILDSEVSMFCYPNGDYDQRVLWEVKNAGYRNAVTTQSTKNCRGMDLFRIGRIDMNPSRSLNSSGCFHGASLRASLTLPPERLPKIAAAGARK